MRRAIDERPRLAIATGAAALVLVVATVLITSSLRGASADHGRAMRADRRAATQTATVHRLQRSSRVRTPGLRPSPSANANRRLADGHLCRPRASKARAKR